MIPRILFHSQLSFQPSVFWQPRCVSLHVLIAASKQQNYKSHSELVKRWWGSRGEDGSCHTRKIKKIVSKIKLQQKKQELQVIPNIQADCCKLIRMLWHVVKNDSDCRELVKGCYLTHNSSSVNASKEKARTKRWAITSGGETHASSIYSLFMNQQLLLA